MPMALNTFFDLLSWGHFSFSCVFNLFILVLHANDQILPYVLAFCMPELSPFWIVIRFFGQHPNSSYLCTTAGPPSSTAKWLCWPSRNRRPSCVWEWTNAHWLTAQSLYACQFSRSGSSKVNRLEERAVWCRWGRFVPLSHITWKLALHPVLWDENIV